MKVGIIAEDGSDVAVLKEITLMLLKPHRIGFNRFVGDGCGKLRRKCRAWANVLVQQGCPWIVVVHDLDRNDDRELKLFLSEAVAAASPRVSVVLIPRREIEAWLLYDPAAIAGAFNESTAPLLPGDPESILDPKKYLRDLVWRKYRKQYINTIHNPLIAKRIDLHHLNNATSFAPHPVFAATVKDALDASGPKRRQRGNSRRKMGAR